MKLFNIILLLIFASSASCQNLTKKSLLYYDRAEVDTILSLKNDQIYELIEENTQLLSIIDSLEGAATPSGSLVGFYDTAYVYLADTLGNSVEVRKTDGQINVWIVKGDCRLAAFYGDNRMVYFMEDTTTKASLIEDGYNYMVSSDDWEIKIDKK